jgi:hypothetical protein
MSEVVNKPITCAYLAPLRFAQVTFQLEQEERREERLLALSYPSTPSKVHSLGPSIAFVAHEAREVPLAMNLASAQILLLFLSDWEFQLPSVPGRMGIFASSGTAARSGKAEPS